MGHIQRHLDTNASAGVLEVLDLGLGTGRFLEKLRRQASLDIRPFGLDISAKMIDVACTRIPDLQSAVDDAANLDGHFPGVAFDLVATHFITGFVPMQVLAPKIHARLEQGGLWSLVGGTRAGFPVLQKKVNSRFLKWLFGTNGLEVADHVSNPADAAEVVDTLRRHDFEVCQCETFAPDLRFRDLREFLEFGYYGGWLTPFLEELGLHKAGRLLRLTLNTFVFPVQDHHEIVIALARKK
jgi:SAM-dependent methyltransferase